MPNPFPGVDPFIEPSHWPDFHAIFLVTLRTAINRFLPAGYRAEIDERAALPPAVPVAQKNWLAELANSVKPR